MKLKLINMIILFAFLTINSHATLVDGVVAVINDEIITASDLEITFFPFRRQYESIYKGSELNAYIIEGKTKILNKMIDEMVIIQDAKEKNIKVKRNEIDEHINSMKLKFQSEADFLNAIKRQALSYDALEKRIEKSLLINKYKQHIISPSVQVLPVDLLEFYTKNKSNYIEAEEVKASQIFVKKGDDRGFAKLKIDEISESIKNGEKFEDLVDTFSREESIVKSGDLGFFKRGQMTIEIEDVVFGMQAGEISKIIESEMGFHILKVTARRERKEISFNEVQDSIKKTVFKYKAEERYNKILKTLREKAYIEVKMKLK